MLIPPPTMPQASKSTSKISNNSRVIPNKSEKTSKEQDSPSSSITTLVPPEGPTSIPETAPEQARQRTSNTSFGSDGITASTSAYGHLLQITRYFGNKPSGFFCVDLEDTPPPFLVNHRAETLQQFSADSAKGMQLHFQGSTISNQKPAMSFIHDRWPCFEAKSQVFDLGIEYFIYGETVYQTYTFKLSAGSKLSQEVPTFTFSTRLFLRSLNFATSSDENERSLENMNYDVISLNNDNNIMRIHRNCHNTGLDDRDAVALVVSPFINDYAWRTTKSPEEGLMMITLDQITSQELRTNEEIRITLAYTLQLVSPDNLADVSLPISPKMAKEHISKLQFEIPNFVEDLSLNFTLRRNLEHILTVCSIPIGKASADDEIRPVALTCGDISGHRVAAEASFYAFEFLLVAFQFYNDTLKKLPHSCPFERSLCDEYACRMRSRIWRASRGHLEWLLLCSGMEKNRHYLRADYWATGEEIVDGWNGSNLPQKSLTNATLSIIKFANFHRMTGTQCDVSDKLRHLVKYWIQGLHKKNKNYEYVFPSVMEATPHIFNLSDHALIWWCIKSAEELGLEAELKNTPSGSDEEQNEMSYSSREMKARIFRNFITENPRSNKSTIAFSRSLPDTRFELKATDTVIFYAIGVGLLQKEEVVSSEQESVSQRSEADAWNNTMDCQSLKGNRDVNWDHPLQFALAIIMSAKGHLMNKRTTIEMYGHAKLVLLQGSSPNGLFSGHLNESKERPLFENELMRDSYWHTTFEVPYILWKYGKSPPQKKKPNTKNNAETKQSALGEALTALQVQNLFMSMAVQPGLQFQNNQPQPENNTTTIPQVVNQHKDLFIKKNATFNNSINQRNIVEVSDEWLYDQPEFFKYHRFISEKVIKPFCKEPGDRKTLGKLITEATKIHWTSATGSLYSHQYPEVGYILDVPMTKGRKANMFPRQVSNSSICEYVSKKRTPIKAKKRLLHFYNVNRETALICYLASSEAENISSFFDKHASSDKYFVEDITVGLNKWVTELHLSFYRITPDGLPHEATGFYKAHEVTFPMFNEGKSSKSASQAVMSFRFDGDVFNRYWTCHFLEYNTKRENSESPIHIMNHEVDSGWKANPWTQRKILELLLFDSILTKMLEGIKEIIEEINNILIENLGRDYDIFAQRTSLGLLVNKSNANKIISMSPSWNRLQRILQTVQDDLDENLAKIKLWTNREKEQGQDRPRWLYKHEANYRSAIFKLQAQSDRKVHQLERFHTNISSLNSTLTSSLESMRNYLDRRGSDDIRLFTYVTVVFLPISFATSVFSTSGTPSGPMIANVAATAAIAIVITTMVLVNARILDRVVRRVLHIARQTSELIASSILGILGILLYPFVYYFARYFLFPFRNAPSIGSTFETETFGKRFGIDQVNPVRDARKHYDATVAKKKEKQRDLEAGVAQT